MAPTMQAVTTMRPVANVVRNGIRQTLWRRIGTRTYRVWMISRRYILNPLESNMRRVYKPVLFFLEENK